ncbi:MAG: substrate-binding domain-containing protein, partial [Pseudomonadota bacterium]
PIVVVGHHEPAAQGYDTINNDDQMGARLAVRALLDRGYRDIAYLTQTDQDDHYADVAPQREIGYRAAMSAANLPPRILALPQHGAPRDAQIHQILTAADRPRAIFCWSDLDAVPLLSTAYRLGIRVPQDLALIGYDNSPVAGLSMVDLTSIDQDGPRLGKLGAEALFTRMNGRSAPEHILIEPKLIPRGSI